jgi:hypothetical protein
MSNLRRAYANQRMRLYVKRNAVHPQSPPKVNIYHFSNEHPNKRGKIQRVFDYMRSGEWLSTIMAQELWKMSPSTLWTCIFEIRRRGYDVEVAKGKRNNYEDGIYTQYRLTSWEPRDRRTL